MRVYEHVNGACVVLDDSAANGMVSVILRNPRGDVHDKVRCDDKRSAGDYFRAFKAIARNL